MKPIKSAKIAVLATRALIDEVILFPKPGLVDARDNGAHTDMDICTFVDSSFALFESFIDYYEAGLKASNPHNLFNTIRSIGTQAEIKMFESTQGVNTHKGANFSFGVFLAAMGYQAQTNAVISLEAVKATITTMTHGLVSQELATLTTFTTHGERMYRDFGITGIRGEVENGFPLIFNHALPYLKNHQNLPPQERKLRCLLTLMALNDDSNLLKRGGIDGLNRIKMQSQKILELQGDAFLEALQSLNQACIQAHLSPGGSADLLALTLFIDSYWTSPN